nr:hypothetical protein GCM10020093_073480 [Planobispora longispora]
MGVILMGWSPGDTFAILSSSRSMGPTETPGSPVWATDSAMSGGAAMHTSCPAVRRAHAMGTWT